MKRNESFLAAAAYFWSDALNAFMFGNGPMVPSLLDVYMLTGLDITSPVCPFDPKTTTKQKLETKNIGGWAKYVSIYIKISEHVDDREHTTFLNLWLQKFVFCGSTLSPTTNLQSIAELLVTHHAIPLGKYLLGVVYLLMHQVTMKFLAG